MNKLAAVSLLEKMEKIEKPENTLPAYYWRDYFGIIPEDAVAGGLDIAGNATYVGQALVTNYGILPGRIAKECNVNLTVATYFTSQTNGHTHTTNGSKLILEAKNFIKILCCNMPGKFKWIKTCVEDIPTLTGHHLVAGGITLDNHIMYIGKVFYDRCTLVGPVLVADTYIKGIYIPDGNGKSKALTHFDVLVYEN